MAGGRYPNYLRAVSKAGIRCPQQRAVRVGYRDLVGVAGVAVLSTFYVLILVYCI